ncbi:hypothetical protein E143388_08443 [Rhodococcus opacus]|nr:hypothetical protein E143388_08443 [Rhodococcus opacus]
MNEREPNEPENRRRTWRERLRALWEGTGSVVAIATQLAYVGAQVVHVVETFRGH